jgi:hypothetical protein
MIKVEEFFRDTRLMREKIGPTTECLIVSVIKTCPKHCYYVDLAHRRLTFSIRCLCAVVSLLFCWYTLQLTCRKSATLLMLEWPELSEADPTRKSSINPSLYPFSVVQHNGSV